MSWSLDRRAQQEHSQLLDVRNREHLWVTGRTLHRILDGHLPADEQVQELLMGAVGDARAVLAVTDHRAVVAVEPRGHEAAPCTDLPLDEITEVEWTRHGPTGCVVLRTRGACHVLKHVELRHGPEVTERLGERVRAARAGTATSERASA